MKASILIVSKNRKFELEKTLSILQKLINVDEHEVLVLLDGCDDKSENLIKKFDWVCWTVLESSIGASRARNLLYKNAKGDMFIGFDDDAHPLQHDFINIIENKFDENNNVGIIAFQEIKGVFKNDEEAMSQKSKEFVEFLCNDFVGCGFAIKKEVYQATNGFPEWMDIYGEESCVSIEVLSNNKDILYTNKVIVNHRVNKHERMKSGRNYFRFGKQLKNTAFYYIIYYKNPSLKLLKLFWHNFTKYALEDLSYFKIYFHMIILIIYRTPKILKHRRPIDSAILERIKKLPSPTF